MNKSFRYLVLVLSMMVITKQAWCQSPDDESKLAAFKNNLHTALKTKDLKQLYGLYLVDPSWPPTRLGMELSEDEKDGMPEARQLISYASDCDNIKIEVSPFEETEELKDSWKVIGLSLSDTPKYKMVISFEKEKKLKDGLTVLAGIHNNQIRLLTPTKVYQGPIPILQK